MAVAEDVPEVKALIILDTDGSRLAARYFNREEFGTNAAQLDMERKVQKKARAVALRSEVEIALIDGYTVAMKAGVDVTLAAIGSGEENELILANVLECVYETLGLLLKGVVDRRSLLTNLELALLTMDETVDGGMILELDPAAVEGRVMLRGAVGDAISGYRELTVTAVVDKLRDRAAKQFGKT